MSSLRRDLAEALKQQRALTDVLSMTSRSAFDLAPVLETVIQNAVRLSNADSGSVVRIESGVGSIAASVRMTRKAEAEMAEFYRSHPMGPSRGSLTGRVLMEGRSVQIPDVAADPEYQRPTQNWEFSSLLGVPLVRPGTMLGVLVIRRRTPGAFSPGIVKLVEAFADQAAIAIENVRLFNETKEALGQQSAIADVLKTISRSAFDLKPVLDTVVENAARLCGADAAWMTSVDGDDMLVPALAHFGTDGQGRPLSVELEQLVVSDTLADLTGPEQVPTVAGLRRRLSIGRSSIIARPAAERRSVVSDDITTDPTLADSRFALRIGVRSVLGVPMIREGTPIGVLVLARHAVRPFSQREIELAETFADQAAIAIENVRLYNETTEALEQQTATAEVLKVISSSAFDVQPTFVAVRDAIARLCRADRAAIFRRVGDELVYAEGLGSDRRSVVINRAAPVGRAVLDRAVVNVPDIRLDPEVMAAITGPPDGFLSRLAVPVLKGDEVLGAIAVHRRGVVPFTEREVELVTTFADQIAIALENVRLFNETKESLERQTALAGILRAISASPTDVQPVLDAIAENAARFCAAEDATVGLLEGSRYTIRAHFGDVELTGSVIADGAITELNDTFVTGQAILERRTVHVPDLQAASERYPQGAAVSPTTRAIVSTPLLRMGEPIGGIFLRRTTPTPFTDSQIALVEAFAQQAVIAIENVRLFNETKESLEQQTAVAEILKTISRSAFDLRPVLETLVEQAARLCEADHGSIHRWDGSAYRTAAFWGPDLTDAYKTEAFSQPRPPARDTLIGRTGLTRDVVHITDVLADPEYAPRDLQALGGYRSVLGVPLLRDGSAIGVFGLMRNEVRPFTERQIELVRTFADQAAIAMENVRLFSETKESLEQQTAVAEVLKTISRSAFDLQPVLEIVTENAVRLSGADIGWLARAEGNTFKVFAFSGGFPADVRKEMEARPWREFNHPLGQTAIMPRVLSERRTQHIRDMREEVDLKNSRTVMKTGTRTALGVPMLREEEAIGGIVVARYEVRPFSEREIALVQTFADQAAIAIENVRLFNEIEHKSHQLEIASRHKSEFLANMSHELRTPLNAIIGFTDVMLQEMFGPLNEKQKEYLDDVRGSGTHLLSLINDILDLSKIEAGRVELETSVFSLADAIENALTLVRERASRHGITLAADISPDVGTIVADERKVKQIVVNLLTNAVKFTPDGGWVGITAGCDGDRVQVAIRDTGIGIAPEDQDRVFEEFQQVGKDPERSREGTGLGLTLSKRFVELHGGRIWVDSEVGKGSTFSFSIPVRQTAAAPAGA